MRIGCDVRIAPYAHIGDQFQVFRRLQFHHKRYTPDIPAVGILIIPEFVIIVTNARIEVKGSGILWKAVDGSDAV
jgi:hypothetical protein